MVVPTTPGTPDAQIDCRSRSTTNVLRCLSALMVTDCARHGDDVRIVGTGFGLSGAKVFVGGQLCETTHMTAHVSIQCRLAPGKLVQQPMFVYQGRFR